MDSMVGPEVVGSPEATFIQALVIPVAMFMVNMAMRKFLSLPQSPASDLVLVFVVWDFSLVAEPNLAVRVLRNPIPGTTATVWIAVLCIFTFFFWMGLLLKHERPIHSYYAQTSVGTTFPYRAWTLGWVLASGALALHFYLFPLRALRTAMGWQ
jgi:hypothetical protein